jgi:hypothetical protein
MQGTKSCIILLAIGAVGGAIWGNQREAGIPGSVKDFGAVGDGSTDDTQAVQRAVDSGKGVYFPSGVYRISRTVTVSLDQPGFTALTADGTARIVHSGPGPAFRFRGLHEGTADPDSVQPKVWDTERAPAVSGLEIVGSHPESDGIEADGTMQLTLDRVIIRGCRHAIHLVNRNRNVLITDCHLYDNRGIGVYYDQVNLHQSNIVGCHISYCKGGGIVSRGGDVRNIQVTGCDIEGNVSGPEPTANIHLDSTGGSVGEVAITGCTIQHASTAAESANIRITGGGEGGSRIGATREGHVTITGNVFSDVQVNVDIASARGVTLVGNTFWMGYRYNLRVKDSRHVVVGPNAFERNPRYDYGTSLSASNAVLFEDCADCTLSSLHLHEVYQAPAALTLSRCRRMNVTGLSIVDCKGVGLHLKDVSGSRVSDCLIQSDLPQNAGFEPIKVEGGEGNQIVDNLNRTATGG